MEAFFISCTTCQARLRVRQSELIGQILPCPKCGGMVLVEPIADDGVSDTATSNAETGPTAPRSDSFEHIEQLLEGKVPTPTKQPSRWRVADGEGTITANEPTAETTEDAAHVADQAADDAVASSPATSHRVAFIGTGIVAGGLLAVAVAGWMLSRPSQATVAVEPPSMQQPIDPQEEQPDSELSQGDASPSDAVAPSVSKLDGPLVDETQEIEADPDDGLASLVASGPVNDGPPPVPSPVVGETPDVPPAVEPDDGPESAVDEAEPTNDFVAGDELADFARWLQDVKPDAPQVPEEPAANPPADDHTDADSPSIEEPTPEILPSRTPPPPVNAEARLAAKVSALKMDDVPAIEALRVVSSISGIPISVDPNALGRRNRPADFPVKVLLEDASVEKVLERMLKGSGLTFVVQQGQIRVTTVPESRQEYIVAKHRIGDLANGQPEAIGQLAEWVRSLFYPQSWIERGGEAECQIDGETLVVSHRDTTQYRILAFFEKLRAARGMPLQTPMLEQRVQLDRRAAALDEAIVLRLWQAANLDEFATEIERQIPVRILVDWQALYDSGWTPQDRFTLLSVDQPLHRVLDELLTPMGLRYRSVDGQTIEITTPAIIASEPTVEIYRLAGEARSVKEVRDLSRQIANHVGKQMFLPNGEGAILFDAVSQSIVVSLPASKQREVMQLLSDAGTLR